MNRIKCGRCDFVNLASDSFCRRCGEEIGRNNTQSYSSRSPREAAKRSSWLYTLLFLALVCGGAYYMFSGVERSYDNIKANEVNRIAAQPKQPTEGLSSRGEQDKKRAGQYGNSIQNSQGLSESQKHNEEVKKLMQSEQNKMRK